MNREIKFRAWHTKYLKMEYYDKELKEDIDYWDGCKGTKLSMINSLCRNNNFILMQYTGLKDKNGKEIYEGDVLQGVSNNPFSLGHVNNYQVMWGVDSWHIKGTHFSIQELKNYCNNNIEIIGNIYENPEILNKEL